MVLALCVGGDNNKFSSLTIQRLLWSGNDRFSPKVCFVKAPSSHPSGYCVTFSVILVAFAASTAVHGWY